MSSQPCSQGLSLGCMGKTLEAAGHVTRNKFVSSWGARGGLLDPH